MNWLLSQESSMSYVTLVYNFFDKTTHFYGAELGFPVNEGWDRINGRGQRFDLHGGLRVEILDNMRERRPLRLCDPAERFHMVVEVNDIEAARRQLARLPLRSQTTSWEGPTFQIHDPDGVPVTFLQLSS
jgi:catechol 2,3-dioxygenase-like lactoylglutathione lyase family enzyme